jgi:sec-independent protein translocase protein TatB
MFDIGMTELLLIGIVALIVVGPKDLPVMFHTLGRFTAKARALGREFSRAMNDAAKESGVKDVAADLRKATSPKSMGLDALKGAADKFEKWDPSKPAQTDTEAKANAPAKPAAERGGETAKLAKEREEAKQKIQEATARRASERIAREKAEAEAAAAAASETPEKAPETSGKSET